MKIFVPPLAGTTEDQRRTERLHRNASIVTTIGLLLLVQAPQLAAETEAQRVDHAPQECPAVEQPTSEGAVERARVLIASAEACLDADAFGEALDQLVPSLFRRDADADPWYLAGRAKFGLARLGRVAGARTHHAIGTSYADGAIVALREALEREPGHAAAATLLASPVLRRLARADEEDGVQQIRIASRLAQSDTELLLLRARRELGVNEPDSALVVVAQLLAVGGDTGLALLERARALLMAGRLAEGQSEWLEGLAAARSNEAISEYRADLRWVASDRELSAFDSLSPSARVTWADRFWSRRGAADFRPAAERLAEHERRIRFALAHFPLRRNERDYNKAMPYRSDQQLVDDRGVIYVRHGAPTRIIRSGKEVVNGCPIYSWHYEDGPDRGLLAHFRPFFSLLISIRRFCSYADFRLVPGGIWVGANAGRLAVYDSLYAEWIDERRPLRRQEIGRAVVRQDADRLMLAVNTDAHPRHFDTNLGAVVRAYALAAPARLLFAFSAPPGRAGQINIAGRPAYPLRIQLTALPRGGGAPITLDTTIMYDASRDLDPDQWLVGSVELPVPPGDYELRSLVTGADPDAGSFSLQAPLEVRAASASEPVVTALVLGTRASELRWTTGAGSFPLSPLNAYPRAGDVETYLEARGLPAAADVEVRLRLSAEERPDESAVELRFMERPRDGRLVLRQTISLARLEPGFYVLTAEIALPDGRVIARSQRLAVSP